MTPQQQARQQDERNAFLRSAFARLRGGPLAGDAERARLWKTYIHPRTIARLRDAGIVTLADAAARTTADLRTIPRLNGAALANLEAAVHAAGLTFREATAGDPGSPTAQPGGGQ